MSTALDILKQVRHAINPACDVMGALNEAIRVVAKRLYILKSKIIHGDLSVSIWAAATATGTDIAFVDSNPDTITSVTTDLSGFTAGQHITTDDTVNTGPFELGTVATNTLALISTDTLTAAAAGSSITVTSDNEYGDLPSDFWMLDSYPYLSGYTSRLRPLPSIDVKLVYGSSTGQPLYYEIKGTKIYVTPATGGSYTIVGDYIVKPTKITATGDTMPYSELFDDVIADYMKLYFKSPPGGTVLMPQNLTEKIDIVASGREKKAPFHTNVHGMGISWGWYT